MRRRRQEERSGHHRIPRDRAMCACAPWGVLAVVSVLGCGDNLTHPDLDQSGQAKAFQCLPNLDGRIDASEVEPRFEGEVRYLVSPAGAERSIDPMGRIDSAGRRLWDLSADLATDDIATVTATPMSTQWYAPHFPDGQFWVPSDRDGKLVTIYRAETSGLYILGVASVEESPVEGQTLLRYLEPAALYRYPLASGDAHTSIGVVDGGTLLGLPYHGRDVYRVSVPRAGQLALPDVTFEQAHQVLVEITAEPSFGTPVTRRLISYLFECFGEVARATSRTGETEAEFLNAAELRRYTLRRK